MTMLALLLQLHGHASVFGRIGIIGFLACFGFNVQTIAGAQAQAPSQTSQASSSDLPAELAREVEAIEERFAALQATVSSAADAAEGTVVAWYPTSDDLDEDGNLVPPTGWLVCDGTTDTPDLRNRFIYGTTTPEEVGDETDAEEHTHEVTLHGSTHNEAMDNSTERARAAAGHTHSVPPPPNVVPLPPMVKMVYIMRGRSENASEHAAAPARFAADVPAGSLLSRQTAIAAELDALEARLRELGPSRIIVAWYPTADNVDADGNLVPPRGWLLGDGTRGTPKLQDRFIFGTATIEEVNTRTGAATHGHTVTTGPSGVHPRRGDTERRGIAPAHDHRHTLTLSNSEHLPPALRMPFIMSTRRPVPEPEATDTLLGMMLANTRRLERLERTVADVIPPRAIVAWYSMDSEVDIAGNLIVPAGWVVCDGTNGTPKLINRGIYGTISLAQVGQEVGSATHSHGGRAPLGGGYAGDTEDDPDIPVARGDHWHDVAYASEASHLPALVRLVYLMKQGI